MRELSIRKLSTGYVIIEVNPPLSAIHAIPTKLCILARDEATGLEEAKEKMRAIQVEAEEVLQLLDQQKESK